MCTISFISRIRLPVLILVTFLAFVDVGVNGNVGYFQITGPSTSSPHFNGSTYPTWSNGSPYPVQWSKGTRDGVDSFDIELARLNTDGIVFVAMNVPATTSSLNVLLQDVPAGDDYFLLCMNSTHGITYAVSSRFAVLAAPADSHSGGNPSPNPSAPTVTVTSQPNPLVGFAQTFGPTSGGVRLASSVEWRAAWGVVGAVMLGSGLVFW
ncbi:hypothetical protein BJ138DRAFT_1130112 [Hygrophoropsis aurantiaca]|uniref:Uncharacterized protein n=1 Tax=Hygrophoropsis aurantiaca TaxID=72124 RepID=A0ACB7ZYH7_9AGAM|nr:hypothetical protein BJ138DRAFT_1130112 [Hygrophoropsis aurantiaca]